MCVCVCVCVCVRERERERERDCLAIQELMSNLIRSEERSHRAWVLERCHALKQYFKSNGKRNICPIQLSALMVMLCNLCYSIY